MGSNTQKTKARAMVSAVKSSQPFTAKMLINGKWVAGNNSIDVVNPARNSEIVGSVPRASPADVNAAIEAARSAQHDWGRKSFSDRAKLLTLVIERMAQSIDTRAILYTRESGRVLSDVTGELKAIPVAQRLALDLADELDAGRKLPAANGRTYVRFVPYGVVVSIVPWNAPVTLAFLQVIPALLAGNSVVLKPPETCPLTLIYTIEMISDLLPAGILNVITGLPNEIGDTLTTHPEVDKIGFTGSIGSARHIMSNAAKSIKGVTLELGGNDPAIFLEDCDLGEETMRRVCHGAFAASGQVCMAIKRIYVPERIAERFVAAFLKSADSIIVGDGLEVGVTMGPMHSRNAQQRALDLRTATARSGAAIREVGKIQDPATIGHGYFVIPAIATEVADDSALMMDEQFCPLLPITTYRDIDEVVARANNSHFGLGASIWGKNIDNALAVGQRIEAGTVWVNTHGVASVNRMAPYGGLKQSGIGRKAGLEGVQEYLQLQTITTFET